MRFLPDTKYTPKRLREKALGVERSRETLNFNNLWLSGNFFAIF